MDSDLPSGESKPAKIHDSDKDFSVSNRWLVTGLVSFAIFLIITYLVISGATQSPDAKLALVIYHMNIGSGLSSLVIFASIYGREYFWIPVVAVMLIFGKKDTKLLAIEFAALFIVGIIAGEAMKYIMFRARPFETLSGIIPRVPADTDSSYPSGHALIVSIGAIFSLAKFRRKGVALLLTVEAAIVCYSRVYVGMHYPLDVVSGIFLGSFIVFTSVFVLERSAYLKRLLEVITKLATRIIRIGLFTV